MGCQLGKVSWFPPTLPQGLAPEPSDHPDHIHGGCCQELLEVRAHQPQIPTPAEIKTSYPLREAALHPRPQGVLSFELGGLLALASGLERLMVRLQADGELPWGVFRRGARPTGGIRATGESVEPDAHDRIARHIVSRSPVDTGLSLRAARLLGLPIDDKGLQVIALPFPPLPAVGPKRRTNHIDLMLSLGGDQEVRIDIAAVEQVCPRQEIPIGQVLLDGESHDAILRGGWRRHHLRDEIGVVGISGLGEVELIAIGPDLAGEPLAFTGVLRQARLVGSEAVTCIPCWW